MGTYFGSESMENQMKAGERTLREIYGQPAVWRRCLQALANTNLDILMPDKDPFSFQWIFVGCGTSYYLAQAAAASFKDLAAVPANAVPASEILLFPELHLPVWNPTVFPVLISRSGRTSEVLEVGEVLKERGIQFLAVTCDGNELAELTHRTLKLPVVEESTVMTSSFSSMLIALQYIAAKFAGRLDFIEALNALPSELNRLFELYASQTEDFARQSFEDVTFLAQGPLYPIAEEVSLKIMESSSTYAQFFHSLEFRHGPKSIVSEKVLVGCLLSEAGFAKESAVLIEMKELGAATLAIANKFTPAVRSSADLAIELSLGVPELARLVVYLVCYFGLQKGLDPDSPRNLSRVVTLAG